MNMDGKKNPQDEKLIRGLYEKLAWFTFQATKEEFDPEQVRMILQLLDSLDPLEERAAERNQSAGGEQVFAGDSQDITGGTQASAGEQGAHERVDYSDPQAAFERFKKKYDLGDEELGAKTGAKGKIVPFASEASEELVPDVERVRAAAAVDEEEDVSEAESGSADGVEVAVGSGMEAVEASGAAVVVPGNRGRGSRIRVIGRVAAACLVLVIGTAAFGIGVDADAKRAFFEFVENGINSMKITVTGSQTGIEEMSEPAMMMEQDNKVYYDSWEELEEKEGIDILTPGYVPNGVVGKEIYREESVDYTAYYGVYWDKDDKAVLNIGVLYFSEGYVRGNIRSLDNWEFCEEKEEIEYYRRGKKIKGLWNYDKAIYAVICNDSNELEKIVKSME